MPPKKYLTNLSISDYEIYKRQVKKYIKQGYRIPEGELAPKTLGTLHKLVEDQEYEKIVAEIGEMNKDIPSDVKTLKQLQDYYKMVTAPQTHQEAAMGLETVFGAPDDPSNFITHGFNPPGAMVNTPSPDTADKLAVSLDPKTYMFSAMIANDSKADMEAELLDAGFSRSFIKSLERPKLRELSRIARIISPAMIDKYNPSQEPMSENRLIRILNDVKVNERLLTIQGEPSPNEHTISLKKLNPTEKHILKTVDNRPEVIESRNRIARIPQGPQPVRRMRLIPPRIFTQLGPRV